MLLQTSARFVSSADESGDSLLNKIMKIIAYEVCNIWIIFKDKIESSALDFIISLIEVSGYEIRQTDSKVVNLSPLHFDMNEVICQNV